MPHRLVGFAFLAAAAAIVPSLSTPRLTAQSPAPSAGAASCAALTRLTFEGNTTITSAEVIGPAVQGIAATEFAELIEALRHGAAYANVHSVSPTTPPGVQFPGGEIRGQIH